MSNYINLEIKAKIKPEAANALLAFYADWEFSIFLKNHPKEAYLQKTYDQCEDVFVGSEGVNEKTLLSLKKNILDFKTEFKYNDGFDIFLEEFLPNALLSLEKCQYQFETGGSVTLTFDPKKNKIIKSEVFASNESEIDRDEEFEDGHSTNEVEKYNEDWEASNPDITPAKWRKQLVKFLEFTSDLKLQNDVFVTKKVKDYPIEDWFGITDFYFTFLNLEHGFSYAKEKKFLSNSECEVLQPFDSKFRKYLPPEDRSPDKDILKDPKWIEIAKLAKDIHKKFEKLFK